MRRVTFRGTGQLNGPVIINKTLEFDDKTASTLTGSKRNDVILAILAMHYPGVRIDPKNIGIESNSITKKEDDLFNQFKGVKAKNKSGKFTIWSLIFLPITIVWRILKFIWRTPHV
jgi:hypothetical protein